MNMTTSVSTKEARSLIEKSQVPLIIKFTASWCGPCKMMKPVLETIQAENEKTLKIVEVDVDQFPEMASELGIQGVPSSVLYMNKVKKGVVVGFQSKDAFLKKMHDFGLVL